MWMRSAQLSPTLRRSDVRIPGKGFKGATTKIIQQPITNHLETDGNMSAMKCKFLKNNGMEITKLKNTITESKNLTGRARQ